MEPKVIVCWDFDGVFAKAMEGAYDYRKFGEPVPEYIELAQFLGRPDLTVKQILSTTRLNPYPFGPGRVDENVLRGDSRIALAQWLNEHDLLPFFDFLTGYKPYAHFYFDDRGSLPKPEEIIAMVGRMTGKLDYKNRVK